MSIKRSKPDAVKKEHVIQAAEYWLKQDSYSPFYNSRNYDVVINNELFPPKAIVSKAHEFATGIALKPSEFSGTKLGTWHRVLRNLGFPVIDKPGDDVFAAEVSNSLSGSRKDRLMRLKNRKTEPRFRIVEVRRYSRNADVVAERLHLAKGKCARCKEMAPFNRSLDGRPYLEVHHKVPLSCGGEDEVENTEALCPNCHAETHDLMRLDRQFE
jgi:predicted HNH restriction endonuclease